MVLEPGCHMPEVVPMHRAPTILAGTVCGILIWPHLKHSICLACSGGPTVVAEKQDSSSPKEGQNHFFVQGRRRSEQCTVSISIACLEEIQIIDLDASVNACLISGCLRLCPRGTGILGVETIRNFSLVFPR